MELTYIQMNIKTFFFVIILSLSSTIIYSQQSKIDSIQRILFENISKDSEAENNLEILEELYQLSFETNPMQASQFIGQAVLISDSLINDSLISIKWQTRLANTYFEQNKLHMAMRFYTNVKEFYKNSGTQEQIAYSSLDFGNIYSALGVTKIAIQKYQEAYLIFSEMQDTTGIVLTKNKIAEVYSDNYKTDTALTILYENLDFIQNQDTEVQAKTYLTVAKLFQNEYEPDSALKYYSIAFDKYVKLDNQFSVAKIFFAEAEVYLFNEDFGKAKESLEKALNIFEEKEANHKIAECYNKIGEVFFLENNYKKALLNFQKALEISEIVSLSIQKQVSYLYISKIYEKQGNTKKALYYINLYNDEKELFYNQNTKEGFAGVIVLSQNEEKQKEIELLEKEDALKSQQLKSNRQLVYIAILLIIVFLAFTIYFFYSSRKQKKQNLLLQVQYNKINLQKKEIETQSRILEKATRSILKGKDELEKKSNKITSSIRYASRIQKAMLPTKKVLETYFNEYFVFYRPKESVSGDFFWLNVVDDNKRPTLFQKNIPIEEKKIIFSVVDCTGHGVPGAFMSMLGDAYLNQIVNVQNIQEPEDILYELHKIIRYTLQQQETDNNDGMDVSLCVVDRKNKTLKFAGAKNPIIYVQNEEMYRINGDLTSIGGLQKEKERFFTGHTIDVSVPTHVYMYSDGYQDQFGGKYGRKYMAKPFRKLLFDNHAKSFLKQKEILVKEYKKWKGKEYKQMDDITVVGFKI